MANGFDYVNPYNFVRLREMDEGARQTPTWHSGDNAGQTLHSGRLSCQLIALGPLFIPDHNQADVVPLPPILKRGRQNTRRETHKVYRYFFSQGDGVPVIPGSSLKGVIRSVAEAAANGCLGIFLGKYSPRRGSNKEGKEKYLVPFNLEPAIKALHLQPCNKVVHVDGDPDSGLCPTCRLFGMPAAEEGTGTAGEMPNFFAGKVSIGDARLVGDPVYDNLITLTELSSPDPTSYLYYENIDEREPRGRKFYYHHPQPYRDKYEERALRLVAAKERGDESADIFRRAVEDDDGLGRKLTVRPLAAGAVFAFDVVYEGLTDDELNLLLYALELDAKWPAGDRTPGAYHKIGYGKPAGLGSAKILVTEWRVISIQDRYSGEGTGIFRRSEKAMLAEISQRKEQFLAANRSANLAGLRWILLWPNTELRLQYPSFPEDFKFNRDTDREKYQLPRPSKEPGRRR